ncbi:cytochrome P450 [Mycena crocata]|nr:cytochrome P450 [Mycena crocata]
MSWWKYCGAFLILYITRKVFELRANAQKMSNIPGFRSAFAPLSAFGALLPTFSLNPGLNWQWKWRNQLYSKYGVHTMSSLPYLSGTPTFYTRSLDVARQVVATKGQFVKAPEAIQGMLLWGRNLFTESGAEWSRHRRIMSPAFNPEIYSRVWDETSSLYDEMMQGERWVEKCELTVGAINTITTKIALIIISRCGFGQPLAWSTPEGSSMPLGEALAWVSSSSIARLIIPRWMYRLPIQRLRDMETAYITLAALMQNIIATRREELVSEKSKIGKDVFRLLVRASEGEGKLRMSDDELTGNTFLMLFAGHDTTARALDAAIGFLALYEDIQEEVYEEIKQVMAADGKLHFNDSSRLQKVQGSFLEGARLFPAAYVMIRDAAETVVLKTDEEDGHGGQIILDPGTRIVVDVVGIHYNPKYFPEPEEFRPSRWYGAAEADMTMFSVGPRVCIGRRFAVSEGTAFLSHFLRDWKVHIVLNPGETKAQWRQRVMKGSASMTLGVGDVPVRITRR